MTGTAASSRSPSAASATVTGASRVPERFWPSSRSPWRSASASRSRSRAVAEGGAATPPAAASSSARLTIARAASNAALAASPWTAKTTRSSAEPCSRWRRTSSTSTRAASASGKPPTPVPNATSARLLAPSSSAFASVEAVARRMMSSEVGPPRRIVAAWMTHRDGISPAVVSTASPRPIGAFASDSRWTSGPPAREIAPATPPPWARSVFAALAIASTSSAVMSVSSTSTVATLATVPA